ncbi:SDR family oxidoreductase [Dactylosporangium sp. NPDC049140]|uniref:SDR family oxidoreductase n=1 Tax=Dactylosporangium sp. NPDC049140 TaxID=3155647 RepID=UPI0033F64202
MTQQVLVAGGTSGIGLATAHAFAARGFAVTVTGRDQARIDKAGLPGVVADAATDEGALATFGGGVRYDHLVLALGGSLGAGPLAQLDLGQLRAAFEGKFWPHLRLLRAALPHLAGAASVTIVSASSARAALPGTAGLAALNGALEALVGPLSVELAPVRVNAVSPGVIDTPWWDGLAAADREALFASFAAALPAGRVGRAEEVAEAIVALATNGYITGTVLPVAGGVQLATGAPSSSR